MDYTEFTREWSDEDTFTNTVGPAEIEDLPVYPSRIHYQHGGTKLREFAVNRALQNNVSSTWAEFGVEKGLSAFYFAHYLPKDGVFYLFDSFEGIPEDWHLRGGKTLPKGTFRWQPPPTFDDDRLVVVPGWFEDTLPMDESVGPLGFIHIDSDLYSSARTIFTRCDHQIIPGTVILFDEFWGYHFWADGEYKALQEWDRDWKYLARDYEARVVIECV